MKYEIYTVIIIIIILPGANWSNSWKEKTFQERNDYLSVCYEK